MNVFTELWQTYTATGTVNLLIIACFSLLLVLRHWRQNLPVLRFALSLLLFALLLQGAGRLLRANGNSLLGEVVYTAGWVGTGLAVIRLLGLALFRAVFPALRLTAPRIVEDLAVTLGYLAWGLFQLRLAGIDPSSLVTTSAVITAIIAFSMQDTLGNALGGLFLELDDSLSIGDWVRIDDVSGQVEQIRWRHTAIRTRNGELVIVPNSTLMRTRFTVIGNAGNPALCWRRVLMFDTRHSSSPSRVMALAEGLFANADIANIARDKPPSCVLMDMTHGYFRFALRYWLHDPAHDDGTDSAVRAHLYAVLQRAGIELAAPEYFVHTIQENRHHNQEREARDLERRCAALKAVGLFASLSPDEITRLAGRLIHAPFAAGEIITRQGATAHWLYLLDSGSAGVFVEHVAGIRHQVATLTSGSYFGEMGLLTGEPRRATIIANTDVECYRLDKQAFGDILRARPALAEQLSRDLVTREKEYGTVLEASSNDTEANQNSDRLLTRILDFFGMNGN